VYVIPILSSSRPGMSRTHSTSLSEIVSESETDGIPMGGRSNIGEGTPLMAQNWRFRNRMMVTLAIVLVATLSISAVVLINRAGRRGLPARCVTAAYSAQITYARRHRSGSVQRALRPVFSQARVVFLGCAPYARFRARASAVRAVWRQQGKRRAKRQSDGECRCEGRRGSLPQEACSRDDDDAPQPVCSRVHLCVCVRACGRLCVWVHLVRACVHARVRARARACVRGMCVPILWVFVGMSVC
jgi:hypothetical protein